MAQYRKATADGPDRIDLALAEVFAEERVESAKEVFAKDRSLGNLRKLQVASDELVELRKELRKFDADRDPEAIRRQDANPKRSKASWPVGAPETKKTRAPRPPRPERPKPPLPPPVPRPDELKTRTVPTAHGPERVSWWVGVDRSTLQKRADVLATAPPEKTSRPQSKAAVKTAGQQKNDAKRDAKRAALAGKLQSVLKPTAGAFSKIPRVEDL